jgi:phage shock protein A
MLGIIIRLVLWIGLPAMLIVFALGPARVWRTIKRGWMWLWRKRLEPEEILTQVVRQHEQHINAMRQALNRSEAAEADISRHLSKSQENIASLEEEARERVSHNDDLGARAALYKLNLERLAVKSFQDQLERQREHIGEARRRLYLLELQLRQYEVGRSILLSQLAEAKTVEQQYAIANNFDPFSAVAHWQQAEGLVQQKALSARAAELVYNDVAEMPLAGRPAQVDPSALDEQLATLKAQVGKAST